MKTCKDCKWYKSCMDICELSPQNCFVFEQRTNFDKVTVSSKALAKFIDGQIRYSLDLKGCLFGALCEEGVECEECITKWLEQEAEEETEE